METMRLNRTLSCPDCYEAVKPFVIGPAGEDAKGRKMVKVRCPRPDCEMVFSAYKDEEGADGFSL